MKTISRLISFFSLTITICVNSIHAQSPVYFSSATQNLTAPVRIAIDKADNIYVTDASQKLIIKYDASGNFLKKITPGSTPLSIAINENNQLFIGDSKTGKILKLDSNGTATEIFSGTLFPSSMVFCPDNLLYIVDSKQKQVIVIDQTGNVVRTIGLGTLFYPTGITYNHKTNRILVSEHGGIENEFGSIIEKVWVFDLPGNLVSSFGSNGYGNGSFYRIQGLSVDRCGNIYVPDPFQSKVSVFNENGVFITKFGVYGNVPGTLNVPLDIAINSKDKVWIASMNNGSLEVYKINFDLPTSNITSENKTICSGDSTNIPIYFTGTPSWTFTYTINGLNPTTISNTTSNPYILTVSAPGIYQVSALSDSSITGTCFSGSAIIMIDSIIPTSTITSGNKIICSGETTDISIGFTGIAPWTITYTIDNLNPTTVSNITTNPYTLTVSQAGTYQVTSLSGVGCAGASMTGNANITVNSLPIVSAGIDRIVCIGSAVTLLGSGAVSYVWNNGVSDGVAFIPTVTKVYEVTGTDINGCVNTDTVLITVPVLTGPVTAAICQGSSYLFNTQTLTTAGTYTETFLAANGCDSVVTLTLNVNPPTTGTENATICNGSTFTFGTQTLSTAGIYTETFAAANGCDSVVTLTLTLNANSPTTGTGSATICQGGVYTFGTQSLTIAGTYTEAFTASYGCDSVVTFTINVNPTTTGTVAATICQGSTFIFGTQSLSIAGTYFEAYTASNGCDSIVTLTLNVNPTKTATAAATICQGSTYTLGTQSLTIAGAYTETFLTGNGCDSVVTLTLNVVPAFTGTVIAAICNGNTFSFGTQFLTSAGIYTGIFLAANGCDSVVTLTLNVNSPTTGTDIATICNGSSYIFGTQSLTSAGTYTETFLSTIGCDSVVTLTLNVNPTTTGTNAATICQGSTYNFGTQTLSTAGTYTATYTAANGCDSVVTLTLNVNTNPALLVTSTDPSCLTCCDGSASASTAGASPFVYQWSPGGQTTDSVTGLCVGTHTVCVTDTNGCMSCDTVTINFAIGVNQISFTGDLQFIIYPNPSSGQITMEINNPDQLYFSVEITSIIGQKIYSKAFKKQNVIEQIDLSDFANGMYTLKLITNDLTKIAKLILNK